MVTSVNTSLLSYLSAQSSDGTATTHWAASKAAAMSTSATSTNTSTKATAGTVPKAALDRAASSAKSQAAAHRLEANEKKLATDLRAAMAKAGVKLGGAVEFSVKSDGTVQTKASDADKAAIKTFLGADTSQPSFANRIASQAKEALQLSTSIQQSAAISQAARLAGSSGGVMSLYNSFMQQSSATTVVFSVSASSSSLTYPGSLSTNA
ncbi:hypothetical protein [Roseateles sp. BYS87W]|uniref:Flagellar hook-associated protein 2 C-terminal domain-containing protein n=1 Tax=Pelomonas baiyunensis TaxID=3299026 RepID=A0ABW7GUR7_9BURK